MLFSRKPSIGAAEAAAALSATGLVLIDVREPFELRAGRVPGAINIPFGQLHARLPELDRDVRVAFICHSGSRSARATGIAAGAGYDAVNVRGGMIAWARSGLPVAR
jgi:rhodanese-related sulfurtransferase